MTHTAAPPLGELALAFVPTIPNHVWLAMLLLAAMLLALSTLARARSQVTQAKNAHASTQARLRQAQAANAEIRAQTRQLRHDTRAAAQAAQEQLHYVKRNEVVIAIR